MNELTLAMPAEWDPNALTRKEAEQVKLARSMNEETLRRRLRESASFAHHGYCRPEDLRELAGLALVLARRLDV